MTSARWPHLILLLAFLAAPAREARATACDPLLQKLEELRQFQQAPFDGKAVYQGERPRFERIADAPADAELRLYGGSVAEPGTEGRKWWSWSDDCKCWYRYSGEVKDGKFVAKWDGMTPPNNPAFVGPKAARYIPNHLVPDYVPRHRGLVLELEKLTGVERGTEYGQLSLNGHNGHVVVSIEGDGQYISIPAGVDRRPARIKRIYQKPGEPAHIEVEIIERSGARTTRVLTDEEVSTLRQSEKSKVAFERPAPEVQPSVPAPAPAPLPDTPLPSVEELDAKSARKLLGKATVEGPDSKAYAELLEKHGLVPQTSFKVGKAKVTISDFFEVRDPGGASRTAVIAVVEADGKKTVRIFYRSNSQAGFRVLPARNMGYAGMPGYDKGFGEWALNVPPEVDQQLNASLARKGVRHDVPEEVFDRGVKQYKDYDEYVTYHEGKQFVGKSVKQEKLLSDAPLELKRARGNPYAKPENVKIKDPSMRPDFTKAPMRVYQAESTLAGKVQAMVYRSADGKLEYTLFRDSRGRVWFNSVTPADPKLTSFGVASVAFDPGELTAPVWEYGVQTNWAYQGPKSAVDGRYVDNWKYVSQMPDIQAWYKANNLPIPPVPATPVAH